MLAEGAAAETYRDDGNSPRVLNAATRPDTLPMAPFAPVLHDHPEVKRIWRKLSARAGRVDLARTDDPDLHLRADGVRLDVEEIEARISRFRLPGPVADLRIVSRSAIPSMLGTEQDQRRLGVALRRSVLAQPGLRREVGWDDARLAAAIVHWNTVYPHRAVQHARALGATIPDDLLAHVAPLGWEHIALTGDYIWANSNAAPDFRPLRDVPSAFMARAAWRTILYKSCGDPLLSGAGRDIEFDAGGDSIS